MIVPEKLTEEEIQFLKDNKAAYAVNLLRKLCRVAYTTYVYTHRNSEDHSHGFLAYSQGVQHGVLVPLNMIDFHCQEERKPIQDEKTKPAWLVPK